MYSTAKDDMNMNSVKNSAQNLKDAASETQEELRSAANQAGKKVRNLFNSASDEISHVSDTVTSEIRTNPVRSSLIALGVGVILGTLFRR